MQKQIQFSIQKQKSLLAYSCEILGNLLASAENLAGIGMLNKQYGNYNKYP